MPRRIVVVYRSDNGDVGEAMVEARAQLAGLDVAYIPRENLLKKDSENAFIIVLGGDGTLLGASHRILDNYSIVLGCRLRESSVGYYCSADVKDLRTTVDRILNGKEGVDFTVDRLSRLECILHTDTENWVRTDLALNEFFLSNTVPYFPSRYRLRILRRYSNEFDHTDYIDSEQRSSGLLISTPHGYEGWMRHARNGEDPETDVPMDDDAVRPPVFHVCVRELMGDANDVTSTYWAIDRNDKVFVRSDMHRGYVVPDSFDEYHFNRGTELEFRLSDRPLNLVRIPRRIDSVVEGTK
jgi:NAD kinase